MRTLEEVTDWRGVLVSMGLGSPSSRAFTAFALAASIGYMTGTPQGAFTQDGRMRPWAAMSHDPDAASVHFLLTPTLIASAVYLFT